MPSGLSWERQSSDWRRSTSQSGGWRSQGSRRSLRENLGHGRRNRNSGRTAGCRSAAPVQDAPLWIVLVLATAAGAGLGWWHFRDNGTSGELVLYGNVDLRQVQLAFNNSERIAEVLVQEGDRVHKGQVLARLDTRRLEPQVAQAEAQVAAQRAAVERLHNGSRPEEIAQARANVESAKADAVERSSPVRTRERPD